MRCHPFLLEMKSRPNSAFPSRPFNVSSSHLVQRPVSATLPSTNRFRTTNSSPQDALTHRCGALSPTHRNVYKKLIIDAVQTINCPILYRTLLKMEKVFQSNSKAKHRFIKMVYLCACNEDQDIDPLVEFLKSQMGVCISLAECRQLVLYSSLFGDTSSPTPSKENMKQVVSSMYLHVPQLFYYQKWCRDVKRLESKKYGTTKPTTGYFSNRWKLSGGLGTNSISDLSGVLTANSDDMSRQSHNSFAPNDQDLLDVKTNKDSMSDERVTSSRHLAMLQAIANGEDEEEQAPPPPKPKGINRFKKIALSLVAVGSDLSLFSTDTSKSAIANHTPFQSNSKRKVGQSNVYMLSEAPEYRKLVATLSKGDSTLSPTGVVINHSKYEDDHEYLSWKCSSNDASYDVEDSTPVGSYGFTPGINNTGKTDTSIFNIKGDPIKDGYYVDAASRVEVLNFLDPNYSSPPNQTFRSPLTPTSGKVEMKAKDKGLLPDPFSSKAESKPESHNAEQMPSGTTDSRKYSKSYSHLLFDEDSTLHREDPSAATNPFSPPNSQPKGNRKSLAKTSSRISFKSHNSEGSYDRKMSFVDENDDSYYLSTKYPSKSILKQSKLPSPTTASNFSTSATVGLAKLRLLKKLKNSKDDNTPADSSLQIPLPPGRSNSRSSFNSNHDSVRKKSNS